MKENSTDNNTDANVTHVSASDANQTNHTTQLNMAENLITYTTGISYF